MSKEAKWQEVYKVQTAAIAERDKRIAELELQHLEDLVEAYELIAEWGAYASPYFQEKYDWKGDMNRFLSKADAIRKEIDNE